MTGTYTSHLECSKTGEHYEANSVLNMSRDGYPLLVRLDLERIARYLSRSDISQSRVPGFWRYAPFLPVDGPHRISLGEVVTPLLSLVRSVATHVEAPGCVLVKDESRLPTGSFKARGLCLAVSMARQLGLQKLVLPTNGNAGAALAAYAASAGLEATVLCSSDAPDICLQECRVHGARVARVNGSIVECGALIERLKGLAGLFSVATLREPYRIEGKKTMGLELAEQFDWQLPDVIFYPTGGGTGLIGMWKVFNELKEIGWADGELPRMVAVQSDACAPIVNAWKQGLDHGVLDRNEETIAAGIRVEKSIGDFLILRALRESGGFAVSVTDREIQSERDNVATSDGLLMCPEGAATVAAWRKSVEERRVSVRDRVVLFNCATGLKYPMPDSDAILDKEDDAQIARFFGVETSLSA